MSFLPLYFWLWVTSRNIIEVSFRFVWVRIVCTNLTRHLCYRPGESSTTSPHPVSLEIPISQLRRMLCYSSSHIVSTTNDFNKPYTPPNIRPPKPFGLLGSHPFIKWRHPPTRLPYRKIPATKKLRVRRSNVSKRELYSKIFSPTPFHTPAPILDLQIHLEKS